MSSVIGVLKSNSVSPLYQPIKVCPAFVGAEITPDATGSSAASP
jgi:hypothetical protein